MNIHNTHNKKGDGGHCEEMTAHVKDIVAELNEVIAAGGEKVDVQLLERAVGVLLGAVIQSRAKSEAVLRSVKEKEEEVRIREGKVREREEELARREEDIERATAALIEGEGSLRALQEARSTPPTPVAEEQESVNVKKQSVTELFPPEVIRPPSRTHESPAPLQRNESRPKIPPMVKVGSMRTDVRTPYKRCPTSAGLLEQTHQLMRSGSRSKSLREKVVKYTRESSPTRATPTRTPNNKGRRIYDSPSFDVYDSGAKPRRTSSIHRSTTVSPITPLVRRY
eukprot:TRINITY_DN7909_c0_g1_i5.p1 TRINITY_DN7909_c0_g1~~TRINITY_DN7909_c0_g1_i5.p1  ORF type:complete len:282 (+),score=58.02 TRINITY_DN7909_c0_g1_i5:42-887(+)